MQAILTGNAADGVVRFISFFRSLTRDPDHPYNVTIDQGDGTTLRSQLLTAEWDSSTVIDVNLAYNLAGQFQAQVCVKDALYFQETCLPFVVNVGDFGVVIDPEIIDFCRNQLSSPLRVNFTDENNVVTTNHTFTVFWLDGTEPTSGTGMFCIPAMT